MFWSKTRVSFHRLSALILTRNRRSFENLREPQKSEVLGIIGKMPCAAAAQLAHKPSEVIARETLFCQTCNGEQHQFESTSEDKSPQIEELWTIFNFILPRLSRTPGPRIAAMVALRRLLVHSPSSDRLHLSMSPPGEFCLHSLRSSIRELRVATAYDFLVTRPWP